MEQPLYDRKLFYDDELFKIVVVPWFATLSVFGGVISIPDLARCG